MPNKHQWGIPGCEPVFEKAYSFNKKSMVPEKAHHERVTTCN
jgi:hypothetical protein